jgi:glycosyltransferase involved in cell wall biosynthesis
MSDSEGLIRRDTPEGFAAACVELLRDPERRRATGRSGQAHTRRYYAPEVVTAAIARLLSEVAG